MIAFSDYLATELNSINRAVILRHRFNTPNECIYCQIQLDAEHPQHYSTREHSLPKSKYKDFAQSAKNFIGTSTITYCCKRCNSMKGDKTLRQFHAYVLHNQMKRRILMLMRLEQLILIVQPAKLVSKHLKRKRQKS